MKIHEFNAVNTNLTVMMPSFMVKPDGKKKTGDADKAMPSDRFVILYDGVLEDCGDEFDLSAFRLNSRGSIETTESGEFMDPWTLTLDQIQYVQEARIPLKVFDLLRENY